MTRTALTLILGALCLPCATGCATLGESGRTLVPTRYRTATGPYAVYTNVPVAADAAPIRQLQALEGQLRDSLGARVDPAATPIEVYILDDQATFQHFLKFYYPELPPRRAFFLANGDRRVVYAYMGDRLEEDLRHEATHALLHAAITDLPLWLDEGLAEYFEGPDVRDGVNAEHLGRLPDDVANGWKPDLARLEALKDVRQMSPRDYRESWAWVHYLLNGPAPGKTALLAYLADLRASADAEPLSRRLATALDDSDARLLAHLDRVRDRPVVATSPATESTIRLQDAPAPPTPTPVRRRSFFDRMRGVFGL
jgi:hypothetical protein